MIKLLCRVFGLAFISTVVTLLLVESAATSDAKDIVSSDYPWRGTDGSINEFAFTWVRTGVQQFYRINGRWPTAWLEVTNQGLFDCNLVNLNNDPVNPDATRINTYGDVIYFTSNNDNDPFIIYSDYANGPHQRTFDIPKPPTFEEEAKIAAELQEEHGNAPSAKLLIAEVAKPEVKLQHALEAMISQGIELFVLQFNRFPDSLAELFESGIGPFTPESINPLTGQPFKGDGSAWDFTYHSYPEGLNGSGHPSVYLNHVDANGKDATVRLINRY